MTMLKYKKLKHEMAKHEKIVQFVAIIQLVKDVKNVFLYENYVKL